AEQILKKSSKSYGSMPNFAAVWCRESYALCAKALARRFWALQVIFGTGVFLLKLAQFFHVAFKSGAPPIRQPAVNTNCPARALNPLMNGFAFNHVTASQAANGIPFELRISLFAHRPIVLRFK